MPRTERALVRVAVAVIHGVGSPTPDFAAPMIAEVSGRLRDRGLDPGDVAWQPIFWSDILGPREDAYLDAARAAHRLDFKSLRGFIVDGLGDAAAYHYVRQPSSTYVQVHDRIRARLHTLSADRLGGAAVPLVAMGHSLGSHVLSSYIWDSQRGLPTGAGPDATPFERFAHLAGLITFGSPIPLFTFAYDSIEAIGFPGDALTDQVADRARWWNVFDRDDVLAYPLRPVSDSYARAVDEDIQLDAGRFGVSATPLSHTGYWTDNDFTRLVADLLASLMEPWPAVTPTVGLQ